MSNWTLEQSFDWYKKQGWLVGCNFLPSSCINQIEMFQGHMGRVHLYQSKVVL